MTNKKKSEVRKVLSIFFETLKMEYGKLYADQWTGIDPQKILSYWTESLTEYNLEELQKGIEAQKMKDFPPTLPQFRKLCRPEINFVQSYYEAIEGLKTIEKGFPYTWSHPAISNAAMALKTTLMQMPFNYARDQWEFTLKKALESPLCANEGKEILKIENQYEPLADKAKVDEYLKKLKEITKSKIIS